jgi:hypothetical protein
LYSTYLSKRIIVTLLICLMFIFFNFTLLISVISFTFVFVFIFVFRKYQEQDLENLDSLDIVAPASGKIISIRENIDCDQLGRNLTEIRIAVSWFSEFGLRMPFDSKVNNIISQNGLSLLRFSKLNHIVNLQDFQHSCIILKGLASELLFGIKVIKCPLGGSHALQILPGDKGKKGAIFGYLPFGGTLFIYLKNNSRVICNIGDKVCATKSVLATSNS